MIFLNLACIISQLKCFSSKPFSVHVHVCAVLAQLIRRLTASQKVPGSIPGLAMGLNI